MKGKKEIIGIARRVNGLQGKHQVLMNRDTDDFESRPRFGLMEVVYEWAKGMSFSQITDLTDVLEGTIVRVITRLDETCREVKNAARIIGDPTLFTKMQKCQELIKRDVCHCASLYLVSICANFSVYCFQEVLTSRSVIGCGDIAQEGYECTSACTSRVASRYMQKPKNCNDRAITLLYSLEWREFHSRYPFRNRNRYSHQRLPSISYRVMHHVTGVPSQIYKHTT